MDLAALSDFLAVVEAGGISAGARATGRPKQSVSRRLMQLEESLSVRLFERTTRALRLTAEGEYLRDRAASLLADLDETRRALVERAATVAGPLRISCPVLLGQTIMGQVAAKALARHPDLTLEIVLADRRVALVEEGFDAALRVGPNGDAGHGFVDLAVAETILVAAPSALQGAMPEHPSDISSLPIIAFSEAKDCAPWRVRRDTEEALISIKPALTSSSLMLCLEAAKAGAGVTRVPAFIAREALQTGQLVRLLLDWTAGTAPIRLIYPSRRLLSARLRAFIQVATEAFATAELC
jgi:DNA-binding transcriptional LysR family regulator